jgi:hypothetical protein
MSSISFRCWFCNRGYSVAAERVGEAMTCSACQSPLRVPHRSGGNSKRHTLVNWLIESLVYGGGGAVLGFGLALVLLAQTGLGLVRGRWMILVGLTATGFLVGLLGGERGINWIGQMIRDRQH